MLKKRCFFCSFLYIKFLIVNYLHELLLLQYILLNQIIIIKTKKNVVILLNTLNKQIT